MRAVFFDLYGTLLRYGDMRTAWQEWLVAFHQHLSAHGLSAGAVEFAEICDRFFEREEPDVAADGFSIFERRIDALCRSLALDLPAAEVTRIADGIVEVWQRHVSVDPDARPLLETLRHRGLARVLISNFDHPPHVHRVLARAGLTELFDVLLISGEVGTKKPAPEIFHLALDRLGLDPAEVIHVGDTDDDVLGAQAARIRPIAIVPEDTRGQMLDYTQRATPPAMPRFAPDVTTIARLSELLRLVV